MNAKSLLLLLVVGLFFCACNPTAPEDDDDKQSPDTSEPTFSSASIDMAASNVVTVVFSEPVTISSTNGWTIRIDSIYMQVASISGSGTASISFTLTNVAYYTASAWTEISYNSGVGDVADSAGNPATSFGPESITINDAVLPVPVHAWLNNRSTNTIHLIFSEHIMSYFGVGSMFNVSVGGSPAAIYNVNVNYEDIQIRLNSAVPTGAAVTVSLVGNMNLMDYGSNLIADFGPMTVTNAITNPSIWSTSLYEPNPFFCQIAFDKYINSSIGSALTNGLVITKNGGEFAWRYNSASEDYMLLSIDEPIFYGDTIEVAYTAAQGNIQCYEGLDLADTSTTISNIVTYNGTAPTCTNAYINTSQLDRIYLDFDQLVAVTNLNGFQVMTNGFAASVNSYWVYINQVNNTAYIDLDQAVTNGMPVAVIYTAASGTVMNLSQVPLADVTKIIEYR